MKEMRYALGRTMPVLFGYLFLGFAFGLMLQQSGWGWPWALASSLLVYAGSMQFVMIGLLSSGASLALTAVTTLLVNSRHLFYGLSFVKRFRAQGARFPYLVSALTDETYSLLCAGEYPAELNALSVDFLITALNQLYWVAGSVAGSLAGQALAFDASGIDFSMTALFTVILVDQLRDARNRAPALAGLASAVPCLFLMGADQFLLPAIAITVALLALLRPALGRGEAKE